MDRAGAPTAVETRRDFLYVATGTMGAVAVGAALWPLIDSMNPAADTLSVATTELNLAPIAPGQRVTVNWRGGPVFVVRRTPEMVARARADDREPGLIDPATDASRVKVAEWLVVVGICTHLGCIPLGQGRTDPRGRWGGWFCACHGSVYDLSGRVRKGPAPRNLDVPPYALLPNGVLRIG